MSSSTTTTTTTTIPPTLPHTLTLTIPLPPPHLAKYLQRAISVDPELAPPHQIVRTITTSADGAALEIHYKAATARVLRVAVNGVLEGVRLCVRVAGQLGPEVLRG
ncbi:transcription factor Pcc1-domain-containing protein [Peziza echinospora]|nr:transcription factor Pcc1-domain-containing protein [Peziza echinospora]